MKLYELVLIGIKDCGWNETETYFKCPKCKKGVITYWKDDTVGYRMRWWHKCPVCGFDVDSEGKERFVIRARSDLRGAYRAMCGIKIAICPHCESGSVYFRKDMSLKCRRCGYDSRRDEE